MQAAASISGTAGDQETLLPLLNLQGCGIKIMTSDPNVYYYKIVVTSAGVIAAVILASAIVRLLYGTSHKCVETTATSGRK